MLYDRSIDHATGSHDVLVGDKRAGEEPVGARRCLGLGPDDARLFEESITRYPRAVLPGHLRPSALGTCLVNDRSEE